MLRLFDVDERVEALAEASKNFEITFNNEG